MATGGVGTKWVHGLCGVGSIFESKEQAEQCSGNMSYRLAVVVVFVIIFIFVGMFASAAAPPGWSAIVWIMCVVGGGVLGYYLAPSLPWGPVAQYYADEEAIKERMGRGMNRQTAINDVIHDREKEQAALNMGRGTRAYGRPTATFGTRRPTTSISTSWGTINM